MSKSYKWFIICCKKYQALQKEQSFQDESDLIQITEWSTKILWVLKDGEVIPEPQGGPALPEERL